MKTNANSDPAYLDYEPYTSDYYKALENDGVRKETIYDYRGDDDKLKWHAAPPDDKRRIYRTERVDNAAECVAWLNAGKLPKETNGFAHYYQTRVARRVTETRAVTTGLTGRQILAMTDAQLRATNFSCQPRREANQITGTIVEAGTDPETGMVRVIIETTEAHLAGLTVNPLGPCRVTLTDSPPV